MLYTAFVNNTTINVEYNNIGRKYYQPLYCMHNWLLINTINDVVYNNVVVGTLPPFTSNRSPLQKYENLKPKLDN